MLAVALAVQGCALAAPTWVREGQRAASAVLPGYGEATGCGAGDSSVLRFPDSAWIMDLYDSDGASSDSSNYALSEATSAPEIAQGVRAWCQVQRHGRRALFA